MKTGLLSCKCLQIGAAVQCVKVGDPEIHPITSKVSVRYLPHRILRGHTCIFELHTFHVLNWTAVDPDKMSDAPAVLFAATSANKVGSLETGCWWVNRYTLGPTQMSFGLRSEKS